MGNGPLDRRFKAGSASGCWNKMGGHNHLLRPINSNLRPIVAVPRIFLGIFITENLSPIAATENRASFMTFHFFGAFYYRIFKK